jgi:phosphopentomutase
MNSKRAVLIIMDGLGVGQLPDAGEYGDEGSNTLGNLAEKVEGLHLPFLGSLGLGNIVPVRGVPPVSTPLASYGRMAEVSPGKDSISGHWELAGVQLDRPFPTYPHGFPEEVITPFVRAIGRQVLGNVKASGTEIIQQLGDEHLKTGQPIVYTSADSVFQIAAHERVCPLEELYRICAIARKQLTGTHAVARIIARPFAGEPGHFFRTPFRRDFSLPPSGRTVLDGLHEQGIPVVTVGKVRDIFSGRGISHSIASKSNDEGMDILISLLRGAREIPLMEGSDFDCPGKVPHLLVTTLVDFDMLWGHRNDCAGFKKGLEECDRKMKHLYRTFRKDDLCIITADHGNDPTTPSTDHSREYVPVLVMHGNDGKATDLNTRSTFSDVACTIADYFGIPWNGPGRSLLTNPAQNSI